MGVDFVPAWLLCYPTGKDGTLRQILESSNENLKVVYYQIKIRYKNIKAFRH
jgi:hypothetical protein